MTDSSTHNYLRPSKRCRLVLSTFQAPLVLQLISESCKDVTENVFPALLLHQCKSTQQNHEFKNLIWVQAPISSRTSALPVSVKISFSPDDKQKTTCIKLEQSSALPKTSQDTNQQTTLEGHKDKESILQ